MADREVQFITDSKGKKTHAIISIETYNQLVGLKALLKPAIPLGHHELYFFSYQNITAKGYPTGTRSKPYFVVTKNSQAASNSGNSVPSNVSKIREELLGNGILQLDAEHNCFVFNHDFKFQSASAAATIIAGYVRSGLDVWVNREGFSLKQSGFGVKHKKKAKA